MAPGAIYRQKAFLIKYDWQLKIKNSGFSFSGRLSLKSVSVDCLVRIVRFWLNYNQLNLKTIDQ